jgi:hypothetical protein
METTDSNHNNNKSASGQDKFNRQPFDPQKQFYPPDLFILVGLDYKSQPIKERNPRWHTEDGFYIGGSN